MISIAIMQPYFMPYAGYFRLFTAADQFVIYDDVQFPKEGWVHRNRLPNSNDELTWLTLPVKRKSLGTKIKDVEFSDGAQERWDAQLRRFPVLANGCDNPLKKWIVELPATPLEFIVEGLRVACRMLAIPSNFIYSSELPIEEGLKAQGRVLHVLDQLGATEYINAPGGTGLYDDESFAQQGIALSFLPDYQGSKVSILQRLLTEDPATIRKEIDDFSLDEVHQ